MLIADARGAVFAPLDNSGGRSAAVVRRLGSAIALGIFEDGEQLPSENELAASLNVAPTTLREALAELRGHGLLQTRRGRGGGSFVRADQGVLVELARDQLRRLGSSDLRELGDLRAAVSGAAARLAAQRAAGSDIERLRELVDRLAGEQRVAEQRRIEGRFYIGVAAAAQSVRLTRQQFDLQIELGQVLWGLGRSIADVQSDAAAHRSVVDAIARRDAAAARRLTEEHIEATTARLIDQRIALARRGSASPAPGERTGDGRTVGTRSGARADEDRDPAASTAEDDPR